MKARPWPGREGRVFPAEGGDVRFAPPRFALASRTRYKLRGASPEAARGYLRAGAKGAVAAVVRHVGVRGQRPYRATSVFFQTRPRPPRALPLQGSCRVLRSTAARRSPGACAEASEGLYRAGQGDVLPCPALVQRMWQRGRCSHWQLFLRPLYAIAAGVSHAVRVCATRSWHAHLSGCGRAQGLFAKTRAGSQQGILPCPTVLLAANWMGRARRAHTSGWLPTRCHPLAFVSCEYWLWPTPDDECAHPSRPSTVITPAPPSPCTGL